MKNCKKNIYISPKFVKEALKNIIWNKKNDSEIGRIKQK